MSSGCDFLIFRTSWVYASRGNNFLLTILKLAREREELKVVSDQIGSPTSARLIADTTSLCISQSMKERIAKNYSSGLYHLVASGYTSWYGFAEEILKKAEKDLELTLKIKELKAITTTEYPTLAKRPMTSKLMANVLQEKFGVVMPHWRTSLGLCVEELRCEYL